MPPPSIPLATWLVARGGAAHSTDVVAAGFSRHRIAEAVRHGGVQRVRRSWLVARGVDDRRRAAASVGGRLTCVSAAAASGLWTPAHDEVHVWLPHSASRVERPHLRVHRATPPAPAARRAAIDPAVNILFHVARCLSPIDALTVWESALNRAAVDRELLAAVEWRSTAARRYAALAAVLSDSGLETVFVVLMREIGVVVRQQVWIDGHEVDGVIGERLVVQIDGFEHHRTARDRRRDIEADARLHLRGYIVLRFDFYQVLMCGDHVRETVAMAVAQGLHHRPHPRRAQALGPVQASPNTSSLPSDDRLPSRRATRAG